MNGLTPSATAPIADRGWWADGRMRFVLFCTYYVLATYLMPSAGNIRPYSPAYFALVLPGWLYIASSWRALLQSCGTLARLWWLFVAAALGVAVAQGDVSLAYNGLYLGLLAVVIINSGGYLRTAELNVLFLLTIVGSVVIYLLGLTDYGFLPGQAVAPSCHAGMSFRVSLFAVPSESAALSLFVLLWNVFLPPKSSRWVRWLFIALALYFLALSGIRTAMLGLMLISPVLLYRLLPGQKVLARGAVALLLSICLTGFLVQQLAQAPGSGRFSDFLASYVLRTGTCAAFFSAQESAGAAVSAEEESSGLLAQSLARRGLSFSWLEQTFNRHCSAKYQLKLFLGHPLVGNPVVHPPPGANPATVGCSVGTLERYCDACVMATYWLSRGGLVGIMVIGLYFATLWLAFRRGSLLGVVTLAAFGLIMQGWGVMFAPYNFTFYMLASLVPLIGMDGRKAKPAATAKGNS